MLLAWRYSSLGFNPLSSAAASISALSASASRLGMIRLKSDGSTWARMMSS